MVAEAIIKVAFAVIVIVILIAIVAVQFVLEAILFVFEVCSKLTIAAEAGTERGERALNKKINKMMGPEALYRKLEAKINGPLKKLRDESYCEDAQMFGATKCGTDTAEASRPDYCKERIFASTPRPLDCKKIVSRAKWLSNKYERRCCTPWKRFIRGFLQFIVAIVRAFATLLFAIIRIVLAIVRLALKVAKLAVDACTYALQLAVKGVNDILGSGSTGNGRMVDIAAFWRWLWGVVLLRIWYMGVSSSFSLSAMSFKIDMDLAILSCSVKVRLMFSLDFAKLMASLFKFIGDLFMSLFGMGSITIDCTEGSTERSKAAVDAMERGNTPELGAAETEHTLHDVIQPHGAVFHAAQDAYLARLGARRVEPDAFDFGLEGIYKDALPDSDHDAGDGLVRTEDRDGMETLEQESHLGRHIRMMQQNYAAATSQIAARASQLGARGAFVRFAHAVAAALATREGKGEKVVMNTRTGENINAHSAKTALPTHMMMMIATAVSEFAASPMDKKEKDGGAFTAALLHDLASDEMGAPNKRTTSHRSALLGATAATISRHHAAAARGTPAAAVASICTPSVAAIYPLRALADAICRRATEVAAAENSSFSRNTAAVAEVAAACFKSKNKRANADPGSFAMGWKIRTVSDALAELVGVGSKAVVPTLARFLSSDSKLAYHAVHAINSALADPCEAAAATAAVVCPVASAVAAFTSTSPSPSEVAAQAHAVERCALAASTLASAACSAISTASTKVHSLAAKSYAACAEAAIASLPCSKQCTVALSKLPEHCGAIVPRAEHGFSPSKHIGVACDDALHVAQAYCGAGDLDTEETQEVNNSNRMCAGLLEAMPSTIMSRVAARHDKGHIQYLHWHDQSARGVLAKSMCKHATVHHVDLRGNNLIGTVPDCVWSGEGALGNGNVYLSRNLLSGTIGKLSKGHRNVHVNHNRLSGDLGAALADAHSLKALSAGGNTFTGTLNSLKGKKNLRHLHVEGNALTDSVEAPVAAVLASIPELQSYEISGNRFASHAAANAASVAALGSEAVCVDHVAAGALGGGNALSRSVHIAVHLRVPIDHICPMCGDAGQEANCGAVAECRKHPSILANLPENLKNGPVEHLIPQIAPEINHNDEAVDVVEVMQCALKHEAARAVDRSKVRGSISDVRIERTVPLSGSRSTVLSFSIDATTSGAAAAALNGLRTLRHVTGGEFPLPAHCIPGEQHRARVGVLHDIEVRMGCPPGLHGSRCQYSCRTRWERFDHRILPESDETARSDAAHPNLHGNGHAASASATPASDHHDSSSGRNTVSALGTTVHPAIRKLLTAAEVEEDSDADNHDHFPPHMKHSNAFRDDVLARTHFFHGGDHSKQHKMSMILNGCSVGCRGHANLAQHHCNEYIDSGRTDKAHYRSCTDYLTDTEHYCQVSVEAGDCPLDDITPWRDQTTEKHTDACEVCGLLRHWGQHGLHHEADAAPVEPTSSDVAIHEEYSSNAKLGKAPKRGSWYTSLAETHTHDKAAHRNAAAEEAARVSQRHGYAPHEHGMAQAALHRAVFAAAAGHHRSSGFPHLGEAHNTALRRVTRDLLRDHAPAHRSHIAASLGRSADAVDPDALHDELHDTLLHHAAHRASSQLTAAGEHDNDDDDGEEVHAFYPSGSRGVMEGQFPMCHAPTSCGVKCAKAVDDALGKCVEWVDADQPSGSSRDACSLTLDHARQSCAEESPGQVSLCYETAAAGFCSLLGKHERQE